MLKISVIIPCWEDPAGLTITLESLKNQSLPAENFEVIVGNDGAHPEVERVCRRFGSKCVNIQSRGGVSVARNRAIEVSQSDQLAFVDADVVVDNDWLDLGIKSLQDNDYVAGQTIINITKPKRIHKYFRYLYFFDAERNVRKKTFFPGCNFFCKKKIFLDLGYFDERFIFGAEDVEFGQRIFLSKKYKIAYNENIKTWHPAHSFSELIRKTEIYREAYLFLLELYPERAVRKRYVVIEFFRIILTPPVKILKTKREVSLGIRLITFLWAFFFGFIDACLYLKNRIIKKHYYDFFKNMRS